MIHRAGLFTLVLLTSGTALASVRDTPVVVTESGVLQNGEMTPRWKQAISDRHDKQALGALFKKSRSITKEEQAWMSFLQTQSVKWVASVPDLNKYFDGITHHEE